MKFIVSRTSVLLKEKPCKEAKREIVQGVPEWVVEIKTLDDLIEFYKKYGDLVLMKSWTDRIPFEIEIYDGCREIGGE